MSNSKFSEEMLIFGRSIKVVNKIAVSVDKANN